MNPDVGRKSAWFQIFCRKAWNRVRQAVGDLRSPEDVFTEIYRENQWGGAAGEICSGGGSSESAVADAYVAMVAAQAALHGFDRMVFVDLGCGDMAIGKRLLPFCGAYVGVDVVKYVVDRLQMTLGGGGVRFEQLDIVSDELPDGDVCFVRQVLQHLSNRQILKILPKLRKYRMVYITEHVPSADSFTKPNIDKIQGRGVRLDRKSGINLTAEPFNLPDAEVTVVLETKGNGGGPVSDAGLIQTVLYTPGHLMKSL